VVSAFKLILDNNPTVSRGVLAENVGLVNADTSFRAVYFEVKADSVTKKRDILLLRKPGREVA
jgi:hypothetical protein